MLLAMIVIGALLGLVLSEAWLMTSLFGENGWLGLLFGGLIGALWARLLKLGRRLERLEGRQQAKENTRPESVPPQAPRRENATEHAPETSEPASTEPAPEPLPKPAASAQTADDESLRFNPEPAAPAAEQKSAPAQQKLSSGPDPSERSDTAWSSWLWGGNLPVRIGVLVSLVGIAALLRYAAEQGWLAVPIEARLALVALAAIAALAFGWKQRLRRRAFALSIQGGSIGVLLMVVFAAYRLYGVVPVELTFVLSVLLVVGAGLLAVLQDARWLAILGMLAGFASPLIIGDGQRGPTGMFAWYAVLNLGVFGMAWWKGWPLLNRIGFSFTFIIGALWGYLAWDPQHYPSAQLFLLLFSALYFLIPIFEAIRSRRENAERFDALLVFSLPLVALPLQAAITQGDRISIATAAFAGSLVYLISAVALIKRWRCPSLGRAHAVIAIALATLAIPFAFSGLTVAMIWALQGGALVWFGCQQSSRLARLSGLLLQLVAGCVWPVLVVVSWFGRPAANVFSAELAGALALATAGLVSARAYQRAGAGSIRIGLYCGWGTLFWALGALNELPRHLADAQLAAALIGFLALTSLLATLFFRWCRWPVMGFLPGLGMMFAALMLPEQWVHGGPWTGSGLMAWAAVLVSVWFADRQFSQSESEWRGWHSIAGHGAVVAMLVVGLAYYSSIELGLADGWTWLTAAMAPLGLAFWLLNRDDAPLARRPLPTSVHDGLLAATMLFIVLALLASLAEAGNAAPLPWLPLLNPLELAQILALLIIFTCARSGRPLLLPTPLGLGLTLGFLLITTMALRGVHQLGGAEWHIAALMQDARAQAALTITWTGLGTLAWVMGSRRGKYELWMAGALLLGLVLLKLLLVDRTYLSTVAGILSFLAFGLLSIAIGYLAPAPPRRRTASDDEDTTI